MKKARRPKPMFSLSAVEFRDSPIAGRGVFARRHFEAGETIVAYAPSQRKVDAKDPEALAAAEKKLTLLSEGRSVIIPDTRVPGGWLCNHSCNPNAAIFSDGAGRIQSIRPVSPGEEVTVFYGWVSHNEPGRDPCRCGSPQCRGSINFDISDEDADRARIVEGNQVVMDEVLQLRISEYVAFLHTIGQEHVGEIIATTLVRVKLRERGSVVCAF